MIKVGAGQTLDLTTETYNDMKLVADSSSADAILKAIKLFGQSDFRHDTQSTLPLELAMVEFTIENQMEAKFIEVPAIAPVKVQKTKTEPAKLQNFPINNLNTEIKDKEPVDVVQIIEKVEKEEKTVIAEEKIAMPTDNKSIEYIKQRWKEIVKASHGVGSGSTLQALLRSNSFGLQ
jgi:hypothetical protein